MSGNQTTDGSGVPSDSDGFANQMGGLHINRNQPMGGGQGASLPLNQPMGAGQGASLPFQGGSNFPFGNQQMGGGNPQIGGGQMRDLNQILSDQQLPPELIAGLQNMDEATRKAALEAMMGDGSVQAGQFGIGSHDPTNMGISNPGSGYQPYNSNLMRGMVQNAGMSGQQGFGRPHGLQGPRMAGLGSGGGGQFDGGSSIGFPGMARNFGQMQGSSTQNMVSNQTPDVIMAVAESAGRCEDLIGSGMNTAIILDASASMEGEPLGQAKEAVEQIIQGLEDNAMNNGLEENLSLIVFGSDTQILQHLTTDYAKIRQALRHLSAGGPSSIMKALVMITGMMDRGGAINLDGYIVNMRLVIISDGKFTQEGIVVNNDNPDSHTTAEVRNTIVSLAHEVVEKTQIRLHFLTVGDADVEFAKAISTINCGQTLPVSQARIISREFLHHSIVGYLKTSIGDEIPSGSHIKPFVMDRFKGIQDNDIDSVIRLMIEDKERKNSMRMQQNAGQGQVQGRPGHGVLSQSASNMTLRSTDSQLSPAIQDAGSLPAQALSLPERPTTIGHSDTLPRGFFSGAPTSSSTPSSTVSTISSNPNPSERDTASPVSQQTKTQQKQSMHWNPIPGSSTPVTTTASDAAGRLGEDTEMLERRPPIGAELPVTSHANSTDSSSTSVIYSRTLASTTHVTTEATSTIGNVASASQITSTVEAMVGQPSVSAGPGSASSADQANYPQFTYHVPGIGLPLSAKPEYCEEDDKYYYPFRGDPNVSEARKNFKVPKNPKSDEQISEENLRLTNGMPLRLLPKIPSLDWTCFKFAPSSMCKDYEEKAVKGELAEGDEPTIGTLKKERGIIDEPELPGEYGLPRMPGTNARIDLSSRTVSRSNGDNSDSDEEEENWDDLFNFPNLDKIAEDEFATEISEKVLYELQGGDLKVDNLPLPLSVGTSVRPGPDWMWKCRKIELEHTGTVTQVGTGENNGWLKVKWNNADKFEDYFRFGVDYEFDVEPVNGGMNAVRWPPEKQRIVKTTQQLAEEFGPEQLRAQLREESAKLKKRKKEARKKKRNANNKEVDLCYIWQYQDVTGNWRNYPFDIQMKLEKEFKKRPSGSSLITLEEVSQRVIFSKMEQRCVTNKKQSQKVRRKEADSETVRELQDAMTAH